MADFLLRVGCLVRCPLVLRYRVFHFRYDGFYGGEKVADTLIIFARSKMIDINILRNHVDYPRAFLITLTCARERLPSLLLYVTDPFVLPARKVV